MIKPILYFCSFLLLTSCGDSQSPEVEKSDINETSDSTEVNIIEEKTNNQPETVEFESLDGLIISGVLYEVDSSAQTILLCHQAGYNLHEYDEIAPQLNDLGFNCMSIDQRAGGILFDIVNQTADRAIDENLPVQYVNAEQDIVASIDYLSARYNQSIILWGSSYSSALALHIGAENENVRAVVSFSPGDYFGNEKPPLKEAMIEFDIPFFITSSKSEATEITDFLSNKTLDNTHTQFIPAAQGKHGSKALWAEHEDNAEYWDALEAFLKNI